MNSSGQSNENPIFGLVLKRLLVAGAIASVIWCCYEYSKNEDMCEVSFKRFLEESDYLYPDLTMMIPNQLNETKLKTIFGKEMNSSYFLGLLDGSYWDDRALDIELSDVSRSLDDYMISHCILPSFYEPCTKMEEINMIRELGSEFHTFRLPIDKKTAIATFQFSTSVFKNGKHPKQSDLLVAFQYPNRVYRAQGSLFIVNWPLPDGKIKNNRVLFELKDMEVLKRRNKRGDECTEVMDYDAKLKENVYQEVGCRPFYISSSNVEKVCDTKEQLFNISERLVAIFHRLPGSDKEVPPCTEVQRIHVDYSVQPTDITTYEELNPNIKHPKTNETWFEIRLDIRTDTFKEIKQKRAYSTQSLIGNVGGYLGLFIGFSFMDIVTAMTLFRAKFQCLSIIRKMKQKC